MWRVGHLWLIGTEMGLFLSDAFRGKRRPLAFSLHGNLPCQSDLLRLGEGACLIDNLDSLCCGHSQYSQYLCKGKWPTQQSEVQFLGLSHKCENEMQSPLNVRILTTFAWNVAVLGIIYIIIHTSDMPYIQQAFFFSVSLSVWENILSPNGLRLFHPF